MTLHNDVKTFCQNKIDKVFKKDQYIRIKQHLTSQEFNSLRKIGDPAVNFHKSEKRIYLHHNLFSHITGFKSSEIKSKVERNFNQICFLKSPTYPICQFFISKKSVDKSGFVDKSEDALYII